MAYFVTVFLVVATVASVKAMPVSSPDLKDIATIATQACPPPENNQTEVLSSFRDDMTEAIAFINTVLYDNSQWIQGLDNIKEVYCAQETTSFSVPLVNHDNLSDVQNLRLQALLQMSNYAHFLKSQYNSSMDYANTTNQLYKLWKNINNIAFTLGQLLPTIPCQEIALYTEVVNGHVITASQPTQSGKRIFCYCVLELMLRDCQSVLSSLQANAVSA